MKRLPFVSLVALALLLPQAVSSSSSASPRAYRPERPRLPLYRPGEVIVLFATATTQSVAERAIREAGGLRARQSVFGGHYVVGLDVGVAVEDAVARFGAMREVEYAEPNAILRSAFTPSDEGFRAQWHFRLVNAARTWDIQQGSANVAVAVIDTGIAYEDFGPFRKAPDWGSRQFLQGFDFVNGDTHANDDNFHGTHVASTIGEATNNREGVAGLAFNCGLMPVKVLDGDGSGSSSDVADGIDYAVNFSQGGNRPIKVINMSLGGPAPSETLRRAIDRAVAAGVVVVAAAGNDGVGTVDYPAAFPNVIAVGAVDGRRQKTPYSNFGSALDVMAPGGDLDRDDDNDDFPDGVLQQAFNPELAPLGIFDDFGYYFVEGTSQATPHVAALAALLISQGITDPAAVKAAIENTADDLGSAGRDDTYGHGLIDPAKALAGLGLNR